MTSKVMRENPLFMRNSFSSVGKWEIPLIRKEELSSPFINLIACSDTRPNDNEHNRNKGVHFFVDDYRFEDIYYYPERSLKRYSQYAFILTPDFSIYADMPLWRQMENVAKNRWIGAYWQFKGLKVIPSVSWSTPRSYEFCFNGIEKYGTVAVGMIGCKHERNAFMHGYNEMLDQLKPGNIIVFGSPFPEMKGNILTVDYISSRKGVR